MSAKRCAPIVGVLLAAGSATRFGGEKLLAALPGGTPVGVAALRHLAPAVEAVVAVVRPGDERLAAALGAEGARVTACPRAGDGMGASLAWGVRAAPLAAAWVVVLADMPWIRPESIARVVEAARGGAPIAAPKWRDARGHPVAFAAAFYSQLAALTGDEGARAILAREIVALVDAGDPGVVCDVDKPEDLAR
ncbi:MAG TPA: nucleotidyltransferase family protein [Casimicrobiaceae bacterium]|nr:nucleotidyltransferase family protein [Casimicrobiaceae bacterium]